MDIYWLRNILFKFIIQMFFLLKRFHFIDLPFKQRPNKPQKIRIGFFVKGHKVDQGSEEKG